jgi:transcriptional regulator with XRE-family HTH domain
MITAEQIRAARAMLNWNLGQLAKQSGISKNTLQGIEQEISHGRVSSFEAIKAAFEAAGIEFIGTSGVRKRQDVLRILSAPNAYLQLLDDAYATLRGTGGELLFMYVDNSKSSHAVIESDLRMRHDGIKFRSLISEANPYCLYPLVEYRCIPPHAFENNSILIYADKVGIMIADPSGDPTAKTCHLTRSASNAQTMRCIFERLWETHKMPTENIAEKTYD